MIFPFILILNSPDIRRQPSTPGHPIDLIGSSVASVLIHQNLCLGVKYGRVY